MRSRGILTTAMAAAAMALAGCGDFLSLDARAPEACVTTSNIKVPGLDELPTNHFLPQSNGVMTQAINVPFDGEFLPKGSGYTVKLVRFALESQGGQDMSFIEAADLSALKASTKTVVATYARLSTKPVTAVEAAPDPAPDVTGYIVDGVLRLEGKLKGTPPPKGFSVSATVCFDVATTLGAK